jgi:hypothetical protein
VALKVWPQGAALVGQLCHFELRSVADAEAESERAFVGPRERRFRLGLETERIPVEAEGRVQIRDQLTDVAEALEDPRRGRRLGARQSQCEDLALVDQLDVGAAGGLRIDPPAA